MAAMDQFAKEALKWSVEPWRQNAPEAKAWSEGHAEDSFGPPDEPNYFVSHKDEGKLPVMLIPPQSIESIALGFQYGLRKGYAPSSWKTTPDGIQRYSASLLRHFLRFHAGEVLDPESGLPHLTLMLTDAVIVEWLWRDQNVGKETNPD